MTTGAIFPKLTKFAVPLILSSVLQLLFNAADIVVVGRFAGDNSLAAVGSTSSLVNLLVNTFMGLSIGCNVLAANFLGAGQKNDVQRTVHTSVLLSIFVGIIVTVIGISFSKQILIMMGSPEDVLPLSVIYLKIFFAGITAAVVYNFCSALLRAKGDTKRPLYILTVAGVINVILNLIFVIVFKMGVAGVAWATVASQIFSAVCVIFILVREEDDFKLDIRKLYIFPDILKGILRIGIPAGLQGTVFSQSNVVIQSTVNSFGALAVAGNSVCQSIEGFIYISMNGLAQGSLTFVSQNMGARNIERIRKVVKIALASVCEVGLVMGWLAIFMASDFFEDKSIFYIYSKSPEVISQARLRLFVIAGTYFTCGIMDVMANSLRGMGYSFMPMIVSLIGACGLRILYLFTVFRIPAVHNYQNIFISYPVSWVVTFSVLFYVFVKKLRAESKKGRVSDGSTAERP